MGKLEGKVAVVTGGARDIGRAISVKLALEGAKVCLNYFDNPDDAAATDSSTTRRRSVPNACRS